MRFAARRNVLAERADRRPADNFRERSAYAEFLAQAQGETRRRDRISAQLEKILRGADAVELQKLAPRPGDALLDLAARDIVGGGRRLARGRFERGKTSPVDFAVRVARHL